VEVATGVSAEAVIEAMGLSRIFGGLIAVDDYGLHLAKRDLVGLIGPNGAGKTTAFNLLTGVLKPSAGKISVRGKDFTGAKPHVLARAGIARTFQNIRLFSDLSAHENVMCGGHMRHGSSIFKTLAQLPSFWRDERLIARRAAEIIERTGLSALASRRAGDLSYGDQRRVEIARALATEPAALLLDEPAAGLNPSETQRLVELISRINEEMEVGVLVVEHDMRLVMGLCRRVQVMHRGKLVAEGTPAEVQADPAVIEAYLGTRRKDAGHARG
jgi:branched-chain amino acid transport system ATP-binding protein